MTPCAYVVHQTRSRVRLRIREKRNDFEYFEAVRRQLDLLPGVGEVRINTVTGTILLLHSGQSCTQLLDKLRQLELFDFIDGPEPTASVLAPLSSGIAMIDKTLADSSGGRVDLRALAYIGLMAVTVHQIRRGQVLGPALPAIWQALSLLNRVKDWRDAASADADPDADSPGDGYTASSDDA
ncbi:MAG: HMA2 domain-containing protein [Gammaproteobacteria bacterium]